MEWTPNGQSQPVRSTFGQAVQPESHTDQDEAVAVAPNEEVALCTDVVATRIHNWHGQLYFQNDEGQWIRMKINVSDLYLTWQDD